jgi:hypothetical protein
MLYDIQVEFLNEPGSNDFMIKFHTEESAVSVLKEFAIHDVKFTVHCFDESILDVVNNLNEHTCECSQVLDHEEALVLLSI